MEIGKAEPRFSMSSPLFKHVCVACVLSMKRSRNKGINKPRKKCSIVTIEDERMILAHACMSKVFAKRPPT